MVVLVEVQHAGLGLVVIVGEALRVGLFMVGADLNRWLVDLRQVHVRTPGTALHRQLEALQDDDDDHQRQHQAPGGRAELASQG